MTAERRKAEHLKCAEGEMAEDRSTFKQQQKHQHHKNIELFRLEKTFKIIKAQPQVKSSSSRACAGS